ncbi:MAG: type III-A CRISPR-associated protein Csm2 [Thermodesulfobacteria bacterium]|nr:type III-A CRISPR-associated protein Csm2 [Thermodesulfobacteriota bacterium]
MEKIWINKEKGELNPLAFSELAQNLAKKISESGGRNKNKPSQIRKYYDTIFKLNERAKMVGANFNSILVELNRELALLYYALGREKVTEEFVKMMEELIKSVKNSEDLNVITQFLECFMAFYKCYRPKD